MPDDIEIRVEKALDFDRRCPGLTRAALVRQFDVPYTLLRSRQRGHLPYNAHQPVNKRLTDEKSQDSQTRSHSNLEGSSYSQKPFVWCQNEAKPRTFATTPALNTPLAEHLYGYRSGSLAPPTAKKIRKDQERLERYQRRSLPQVSTDTAQTNSKANNASEIAPSSPSSPSSRKTRSAVAATNPPLPGHWTGMAETMPAKPSAQDADAGSGSEPGGGPFADPRQNPFAALLQLCQGRWPVYDNHAAATKSQEKTLKPAKKKKKQVKFAAAAADPTTTPPLRNLSVGAKLYNRSTDTVAVESGDLWTCDGGKATQFDPEILKKADTNGASTALRWIPSLTYLCEEY
ncbi:hypothetical protein AJ78_04985 [Emergomyces pasteurianus Ep9510]|uniref:Uncharacterized protein n=1 Tax=Emergomyces pasteurianus Ep9510 TaxID=1447872 RepID=A0A1J9PFC7_9EURO|nr:hypothetical protein AJ78_04985 [Emergomyces pasteurianus Ep9510]